VALAVGALIASILTGSSLAQAPAADAKPEDKGWESVAGAGLTLSRGNSKNILATVNFDTKRKWTSDEVLLGAKAGYGKTTTPAPGPGQNEDKTDAYIKGGGQYNHLLTEQFYGALRVDARVRGSIPDCCTAACGGTWTMTGPAVSALGGGAVAARRAAASTAKRSAADRVRTYPAV